MKKILNFLGILLVIALLVAVFTSTSKEQCKNYVTGNASPGTMVNLDIQEVPFKLFGAKIYATYYVTYYKPSGLTLQQQAGDSNSQIKSSALAALKALSGMQKEKYLGLFGKFWRL